MKIIAILLSSLTILMALSQLICGLWIQSRAVEASSLVFHSQLGIGTVSMALITIAFLLVYVLKH